jgi:hypothetical protein
MYTKTTFLRAFFNLLKATKLNYELSITYFNRLSANDQSTEGFLNQLARQAGMQALLHELTSLISFLVIVFDLVNLSARSLSQSDFLGMCSTWVLQLRNAHIRFTALMIAEADLSPVECLFHIPNTTPRQTTFMTTVEFLKNSGCVKKGINNPMVSRQVVLSPNLVPFSSSFSRKLSDQT